MMATRDEIFSVIKGNLHKIVEASREHDISAELSMKDYGADSLEIIEVVSRSMKELKIRVPRTQLSEAKTLSDLIDLFERAAQATTAA
jgi:acyl carrier protein